MDSLIPQGLKSTSSPASLLHIPSDVLDQHIFKYFDISRLMVCSFVCSKLRRLSSRRISELPHTKRHQNSILQNIFRNGWTKLLSWFQAQLRYPSITALMELRPILLEQCISLAAEGFFLKIFLFKSEFSSIDS